MDELAAIRVFVKVVETGSFAGAGRTLGLAPPSVTRRVNELEAMLGVTLLLRSTRKLSLTEAGESYFERIRDIVGAVEEAKLCVAADSAAPSGVLRVTTPSSITRRHIAPAITAFHIKYPTVAVVMRVTDRVVDLLDEGMDVAIRLGHLQDSSLRARRIGDARRCVCASPGYLERAGPLDRPEDISHHAALTIRRHPGANIWRFRRGTDLVEVRVTGPVFSEDAEALVAAACADLGVVFMPEWLVGAELADGRLVELLTDAVPEPARTPVSAVYLPGTYIPAKVRVFIDFLAERFSGSYDWAKVTSAHRTG